MILIALTSIALFFSPRGGCEAEVIHEIDEAKTSIRVQMYAFTDTKIADALQKAAARKVDVAIILDKAWTKKDPAILPHLTGLVVLFDGAHPIAHSKFMVVDGHIVLTGSYNWTVQAEKYNHENMSRIDDPAIASQYLADWNLHAKHSSDIR